MRGLAFSAVFAIAACGGNVAAPPDAAVTHIAGHPITLSADSSVTKDHSHAEVEKMLAAAERIAARDLGVLERDDRPVFERIVPRLARIERRYGPDGAAREGTTLVLTNLYRWEILGEGEVRKGILFVYFDELARRFANVAPEQVAPPDRADYFLYVTHDRAGKPLPAEASVERVVRLGALANDAKTTADIRAWLFAQAPDIANPTRAEGKTPEGQRAHAAWVAWLRATLPTMTAREALLVAHAAYGQANMYEHVDNVIEGFDAFAFGLAVADTWAAGGHSTTRVPGDPAHDLVDYVVAPTYWEDRGHLSRGDSEHSVWIERTFKSDADLGRLAEALAQRNDKALIATVVYNIPRSNDAANRTKLYRLLERHPRTWQLAVLRLIEEERSDGCDNVMVDEANRTWHDAPALRGTALHVIACAHGRGGGDPFFREFPRLYSHAIDAPLFASFLDDGTDAMKLAEALWPAMSKGWSRVDVIVPRLDAFLADPHVRSGADEEPMLTLLALAKRLCEDGNTGETAKLHAALAARARASTENARALARALDETQPGKCTVGPSSHRR